MPIRVLLAMPDIAQVESFAEPWQRLYGHSSLVATLVLFTHVAALLAGGGLALASDRATLRLDQTNDLDRERHLRELMGIHRTVAIALLAAFLSGMLLFLADVEVFASSRIFWVKLALVALLLGNLARINSIERSLRVEQPRGPLVSAASARDRLWRRRRESAMASVALWFVLVFAGTALSSH